MILNILADAPAQVPILWGYLIFAGSIVALVLILRGLAGNVTAVRKPRR